MSPEEVSPLTVDGPLWEGLKRMRNKVDFSGEKKKHEKNIELEEVDQMEGDQEKVKMIREYRLF